MSVRLYKNKYFTNASLLIRHDLLPRTCECCRTQGPREASLWQRDSCTSNTSRRVIIFWCFAQLHDKNAVVRERIKECSHELVVAVEGFCERNLGLWVTVMRRVSDGAQQPVRLSALWYESTCPAHCYSQCVQNDDIEMLLKPFLVRIPDHEPLECVLVVFGRAWIINAPRSAANKVTTVAPFRYMIS
jgi:hypothetical protein